jgi:hypothetical protein
MPAKVQAPFNWEYGWMLVALLVFGGGLGGPVFVVVEGLLHDGFGVGEGTGVGAFHFGVEDTALGFGGTFGVLVDGLLHDRFGVGARTGAGAGTAGGAFHFGVDDDGTVLAFGGTFKGIFEGAFGGTFGTFVEGRLHGFDTFVGGAGEGAGDGAGVSAGAAPPAKDVASPPRAFQFKPVVWCCLT